MLLPRKPLLTAFLGGVPLLPVLASPSLCPSPTPSPSPSPTKDWQLLLWAYSLPGLGCPQHSLPSLTSCARGWPPAPPAPRPGPSLDRTCLPSPRSWLSSSLSGVAGSRPLPDRLSMSSAGGSIGQMQAVLWSALRCFLGAEVEKWCRHRWQEAALRMAVSPRGRNPPAGLRFVPSTNKTALFKCEPESPPGKAWVVNQHGHRGAPFTLSLQSQHRGDASTSREDGALEGLRGSCPGELFRVHRDPPPPIPGLRLLGRTHLNPTHLGSSSPPARGGMEAK